MTSFDLKRSQKWNKDWIFLRLHQMSSKRCLDYTNPFHKAAWKRACSISSTFASLRSMVVHTASTCTPKIYAQPVKLNNDSTCSRPGVKARFIQIVNGRRLHGPRLLRRLVTKTCPTRSTNKPGHSSAKPSW